MHIIRDQYTDDKTLSKYQRYSRRHPERRKASNLKSLAKRYGPDYIAYQREGANRRHRETRNRVFDMYGRKCNRCGFSDLRALQLDHVNNDGAQHRRLSCGENRGTSKVWREAVKKYRPDLFQILCANCNWIKRAEFVAEQAAQQKPLTVAARA